MPCRAFARRHLLPGSWPPTSTSHTLSTGRSSSTMYSSVARVLPSYRSTMSSPSRTFSASSTEPIGYLYLASLAWNLACSSYTVSIPSTISMASPKPTSNVPMTTSQSRTRSSPRSLASTCRNSATQASWECYLSETSVGITRPGAEASAPSVAFSIPTASPLTSTCPSSSQRVLASTLDRMLHPSQALHATMASRQRHPADGQQRPWNIQPSRNHPHT